MRKYKTLDELITTLSMGEVVDYLVENQASIEIVSKSEINLYDVVTKLVGPIDPVGESNEDDRRFDNLEALIELVDRLLNDIDFVAVANRGRGEHSMRKAGEFASKFFDNIGVE